MELQLIMVITNPIFNSCLYQDIINDAASNCISITRYPPCEPNLIEYELFRSRKSQEWMELIWNNSKLVDPDIGDYPFLSEDNVAYSTINNYNFHKLVLGSRSQTTCVREDACPVHIDFGTHTALCQRGSNGLKIHVVLPQTTNTQDNETEVPTVVLVTPHLARNQMVINIGMTTMLRSSTKQLAGIRGGIHSVSCPIGKRVTHGIFSNPPGERPITTESGDIICSSFSNMMNRSFAITWGGLSTQFYQAMTLNLDSCIEIATEVFSIPNFIEEPPSSEAGSADAYMPKITDSGREMFASLM
ncbi:MAG: hypothetical protein JKX76_02110 [Colwellia sp.]|nr:hypothetical protein [Colwellia sp.]